MSRIKLALAITVEASDGEESSVEEVGSTGVKSAVFGSEKISNGVSEAETQKTQSLDARAPPPPRPTNDDTRHVRMPVRDARRRGVCYGERRNRQNIP